MQLIPEATAWGWLSSWQLTVDSQNQAINNLRLTAHCQLPTANSLLRGKLVPGFHYRLHIHTGPAGQF